MLAIDEIRLAVARETPEETKAGLGQYMTPYVTADFLASMFDFEKFQTCKLLDPGAGIGSLTIAFLRKAASRTKHLCNVRVTACEIDSRMRAQLEKNLSFPEKALASAKVIEGDFIETAVDWLQFAPNVRFTHVRPYPGMSADPGILPEGPEGCFELPRDADRSRFAPHPPLRHRLFAGRFRQ